MAPTKTTPPAPAALPTQHGHADLEAKRAELARRLEQVTDLEVAALTAERQLGAARQTLEAAEDRYLVGKSGDKEIEAERARAQQVRVAGAEARLAARENAAAITRLQGEVAALEAALAHETARAIRAAYREAVLRLKTAIEQAAVANAEVLRIWQHAEAEFPHTASRNPQGIATSAGCRLLAWNQLFADQATPYFVQDYYLVTWRQDVTEVLANLDALDQVP